MKTTVTCVFLSLLLPVAVVATQTLNTFYPIADTYITGNEELDANKGLYPYLRIQNSTSFSNVLLRFSQQSIASAIGTKHIVSASLKLYIGTNFNNWGAGAFVDVHRLGSDWGETTATWNCSSDTNLGNSSADCEDTWLGGYYDEEISDSLLHQNGMLGWINFDVTSDIQIAMNGFEHLGWLVQKREPAAPGSVDYASVQGFSFSNRPRLEVLVDDQASCQASSIRSITPAKIPADGNSYTLTVAGQNLNRITSVFVDNQSVTFTVVNASTLTLQRSYSASGEHDISFRSNCLVAPLETYTIEADVTLFTPDPDCRAASTQSRFSRSTDGRSLCWKQNKVQLIGYSGDFNLVTLDTWDAATIRTYFRMAQFLPGSSGATSYGSNLIRILAMGGSCGYQGGGPVGGVQTYNCNPAQASCQCKELDGQLAIQTATMPFKWANKTGSENDGYQVPTSVDVDQLRGKWRDRLKNLIKNANNNGIAVWISLFDENTSKGQYWDKNPWNPQWNSLHSTNCGLPTGNADSLPEFYGTTSCVRDGQKYYIQSVVRFLKNSLKICGSDGKKRCKDVLFDVMNEARFFDDWEDGDFTANSLKDWHEDVAGWVHGQANFMVSANVKGDPYQNGTGTQHEVNMCPGDPEDDNCFLAACGENGCTDPYPVGSSERYDNYFEVFTGGDDSELDFAALHYPTWGEASSSQDAGDVNICNFDEEAVNLHKPFVFDDDGGLEPDDHLGRNSNCNVENWAQGVASACGQATGVLHFYHTGDGHFTDTAITPCFRTDNGNIDCNAWNVLADGLPTVLQGCGSGCGNGRTSYCEGKAGGCAYDACSPDEENP